MDFNIPLTVSQLKHFAKKYQKEMISAAIGLSTLVGFFFLWHSYKLSLAKKAYADYAQCMAHVRANVGRMGAAHQLSYVTEEQKWESVTSIFKEKFETWRSTPIAPLFLQVLFHAAVKLENWEGAAEWGQKLASFQREPLVNSMYRLGTALALLSSTQPSEGLRELEILAKEEHLPSHEPALYYLADWYWNAKEYAKAQNFYSQLALRYKKQKEEGSPSLWVEKARKKLRSYAVKGTTPAALSTSD